MTEILITTSEEIDKDLKCFIQKVSIDYNLTDWEVEFWTMIGENEYHPDLKLIYLDKSKNPSEIKKWFLHEVAHALIPNDEDSRWHREVWITKYQELCKRYNILYGKYRGVLYKETNFQKWKRMVVFKKVFIINAILSVLIVLIVFEINLHY
jgi:hypothetical protein